MLTKKDVNYRRRVENWETDYVSLESKYKIYIRRPTSDDGQSYVDKVLAKVDQEDFHCTGFDKDMYGNMIVHFMEKVCIVFLFI